MILDKEMHIFEHKSKLSVLLIWLFLVFFFVGKFRYNTFDFYT